VAHLERIAIAVGLLAYGFGGYFWIARSVDPTTTVSLATPWDARIPFVPASIFAYASVYVLIALPIFVVESRALFRRAAWAYATMVTVCLLCFRFFPVSGAELRPALDGLKTSPFVLWGLRLNYALDPPLNLFPSLHLAGASLAALTAWKARRGYGLVAFAAVGIVAVSVCTVKQHFWVDAVAGIGLALAVYCVLLGPFRLPPGERAARGGRAWLAFAALLLGSYGLLYAIFLRDVGRGPERRPAGPAAFNFRLRLVDEEAVPHERPDMEDRQPCQRSDRVADLMTPKPMVATPDAPVAEVFGMMNERRIRHVPIVDDEGELQGLVSRWYLLGHSNRGGHAGNAAWGDATVGELMSETVDTVSADCCAAEAARHMLRTKRSSLPVVDAKRRVIGILTEADFLRLAVRGKPSCTCEGVQGSG